MVHKVLLADSSATIQKLVEMALSESEFQLTAVSDGQQALEQLDTLNPDIILAAAVMPKMKGYQLCEYVRANPRHQHTPVVLLIGRFQPFDEAEAQQVGASAKVVKPFSQEQLLTVMRDLVNQAPRREETPESAFDSADDDAFDTDALDDDAFDTNAAEPEAADASFDESATVAISPENLRAHLQSLDNLTSTQDEEMPTIDDFSMDDDNAVDEEPDAVGMDSFEDDDALDDDEPMELHTEDLDDLELDEVDAEESDEAPEAAMAEEPAADTLPSMAPEPADASDFDLNADDSIEDLHLEDSADDLEPVEMEAFPAEEEPAEFAEESDLPLSEDTEPVDLDELQFDEDSADDLPDALDLADDVDDALDEVNLDEDDDALHLGEDEAPFEDDAAPVVADDDTQPVDISELDVPIPDYDDVSAEEDAAAFTEEDAEDLGATDGDDDLGTVDEDALGDVEELELELEDDDSFDTAPSMGEDVLGIESPLEEPAAAFDDAATVAMEGSEEPEAVSDADAFAEEPEEDADFDPDATVHVDDEPFADLEEEDAPEEPAETPTADLDAPEEDDADAFTLDDDDAEPEAPETSAPAFADSESPTLDHDLDEVVDAVEPEEEAPELFASGDEPMLDDADDDAEIRVDEPLLEPEEAAYFADTVRADAPLTAPAPEPTPAPEPAAPAPATVGSVQLDEGQMNQLADMVASRLVARLGSEEIRDIVWQVVPELAEAMIKKRIYQLEQSVDAE